MFDAAQTGPPPDDKLLLMNATELDEELLLVEDSLLLMRYKLRYFPADYGPEQIRLSERQASIVSMIGAGENA